MPDSRGYRIDTVDPTWYPRARKRAAGAALETLEPVSAPRTRLFNFTYNMVGSRRTTLSFGRCIGPAIIKSVEFYHGSFASGYFQSIEVGTAGEALTETAVALNTPRPYTVLMELTNLIGAAVAASGVGLPDANTPITHVAFARPLDIIVTLPEFYAVVAFFNNTANAESVVGTLTVLEGISQQALRNFL